MAKRGTSRKAKASAADAAFTGDEAIVVLHGKETMLRRTATDALRAALRAKHGEFETFGFEGKTAALADVLDELRGYSLMGGFKLVVVDEADEFLTRHREAMTRYAESPVDHAALLLRSDTWRPGNFDKHAKKHGQVIKCDAVSPREAARWLIARAEAEHGAKLEPAAAEALVDRLGVDLGRLDAETAKLALLAGGGAITAIMVDETIGRESDEQAWAVQEGVLLSLATGDASAALTRVDEVVRLAGQHPVLVTFAVADVVRKLAIGHAMKRWGMNDFAIGKALRVWPAERQKLFAAAIGRLDADTARALQRRVLQLDARTKSGFGDGLRNLETFCVSLADAT